MSWHVKGLPPDYFYNYYYCFNSSHFLSFHAPGQNAFAPPGMATNIAIVQLA